MKTLILTIMTFLTCCGCKKDRNDENLTLTKQPFKGTQLRIDGYYYVKTNSLYSIYFFYNNGILLYGGSYNSTTLDYIDSLFKTNDLSKFKFNKILWGLFNVDNNKIYIEHWVATEPPLPTIFYEGIILNDTTFNINKYKRSDKDTFLTNEIYYFHQFSPKPDSTNNFIP